MRTKKASVIHGGSFILMFIFLYLLIYISVLISVSEIMTVSDTSRYKVIHLIFVQFHIAVIIVIFLIIQIIFAHFTA